MPSSIDVAFKNKGVRMKKISKILVANRGEIAL